MALAACPLLRVLADAESPCYELAGGAVVAVHAHAACPLRRVDAAAAARAVLAHDHAPCLAFETPADLRRAVHLDVSAALEAAVELGAFAGGCVADAPDPPFERRFVSAEWGHGLFATRNIPARCVLGEYGGVLRSEAAAAGGADAPSDAYRVSYPAVDAGGSSMYVSARLAGGWTRLINHAPARPAAAAATAATAATTATTADGGAPPPAEWANCAFHVTMASGLPRVVIATSEPVRAGQQLLVDYGREYVRSFFQSPAPPAAAQHDPAAAAAPALPAPLRAAAPQEEGEAAPPPPPLAAALFDSCADVASACLLHPFVAGLADGSTPLASFTRYVAQDAFFLEGFARAYALALAKCPPGDLPTLRALSGFIAGVVEELQLHAGYAQSLGLDLAAAAAAPMPAAVAYVAFLTRTATDPACGVSDVLAAMAPCMRLYAFLGCQLSALRRWQQHPPPLPSSGGAEDSAHFARWIDAYSDPGFVALAGAVEALLAAHAAREQQAPHSSTARLRRLYREAFELEFQFFDAFRWGAEVGGGSGVLVPVAPLAPPGSGSGGGGARPLLLVADWDDTITADDTTGTYARLAVRAALGACDVARARAVHAAWRSLEAQYAARYAATAARLQAELHAAVADGGGPPERALLAFMCQLAAFDSAAVQWCQAPAVVVEAADGGAPSAACALAAGAAALSQPPPPSPPSPDDAQRRRVLSGIRACDLEHAATTDELPAGGGGIIRDGSAAAFACVSRPVLRPGAADCLAAAVRAPAASVHVLSLNWDAGFIAAALQAQGAGGPGGAPRWGFDVEAPPGGGGGGGGAEQPPPARRAVVTVWCNKLRLASGGASDGTIDARVTNGIDKLRVFQQLLEAEGRAHEGARSECGEHGGGARSVYVGDSVTDLLPLLTAHVGIIMPRGAPLPASARAGGPAAPCPPPSSPPGAAAAADAAATAAKAPSSSSSSSSLHRLAAAAGVRVLPLAAASQSPLREQLLAPTSAAAATATYDWQPTAEQLRRLTFGAPDDAGRLAHAQCVALTMRGPVLDGGQRVLFEAGGWDEVRALLGLCGGSRL